MSDIQSQSSPSQTISGPQVGIARRRLLRAGLAATPVLLAVSGRSAMAQAACPGGLTMTTRLSICPNDVYIASSHHTLTSRFVGRSPGYWRPNPRGQTFQPPYPWPIAPFSEVKTKVAGQMQTLSWDPARYTEYKNIPQDSPCWGTGTKFNAIFSGSDSRSFSRILLDAPGSMEWHFCAAYLNALAMPGQYVLTTDEVIFLEANDYLPGVSPLTTDQIKGFLSQTWA